MAVSAQTPTPSPTPSPTPAFTPPAKPKPTPTPTATPKPAAPGTIAPFTPGGGAVPKPITTTATSGLTASEKAVWFMRPTSLFPNTNTLAGVNFVSQPGQPLLNTWYDKADVEGQFSSLSWMDQLLFEATAKSISSRSTGGGLFTDMVNKSAYMSTVGNRVTPQQLMYEIAAQRGIINEDGTVDLALVKQLTGDKSGSSSSGGGSGPKYGTSVDTAISVPHTDPDTAKGLVNQALSTYLGKEASPEELDKFIASLQQHSAENADMTTRTTTTSPGGSTQSSQSTGGVNAQQYAVDWARAQEGSAEFQAASGYFDEFIQAIQNPMDVVR